MGIARSCIQRKTVTWLFTLVLAVGGMAVFDSMAKFEDPEFTIKTAQVFTSYPGATPIEVANEVTDVIETAAQQLQAVDYVTSESLYGMSRVTVEVKPTYDKNSLPQVWDELRRKVNDAQGNLPPGAGPSLVYDDFGDVYGILYALTGEGLSMAELEEYAKDIRTELLMVDGVAKVNLDGVQQEVIYLEIPRARLSAMGLSSYEIYNAISTQNAVTNSGSLIQDGQRVRFQVTGELDSVSSIENLLVTSSRSNRVIRVGDIGKVYREYEDPASKLIYYDGKPAIHIGISAASGGNVVKLGEAIDQQIATMWKDMPHGIDLNVVSLQGDSVTVAIKGFIVNLGEAVAIVIGVLMLVVGVRAGVIIGLNLLIIVLGTLLIMYMTGVALERISLGALIIAMGMLVDNAIVVVDGVLTRLKRGMDTEDAADEVVEQTKWPLLGATVIAILAFSAIGLSPDSTGEFCRSLFLVVLYSLTLSWILAITVCPLMCVQMLKKPAAAPEADPNAGFLGFVRRMVRSCIRFRWVTVLILIGALFSSMVGFGNIKQSFFPNSSRPQFLLNIWMPSGSDISATQAEVAKIDEFIRELPGVTGTHSLVGAGAMRFLLTYDSETGNSAYGQIIADVEDIAIAEAELFPQIYERIPEISPAATPFLMKFRLGPGCTGAITARFSGPDPAVLRSLSEQALAIFKAHPNAGNITTDWKEQTKEVRPEFVQNRGRLVNITREDVANAMAEATDGRRVGLYREEDRLIPIIARAPREESNTLIDLSGIQVYSSATGRPVPLLQVVDDIDTALADATIARRNRIPTIEVMADPIRGLPSEILNDIRGDVEAITLPVGYSMEWGGEAESSSDAQASLVGPMLVAILIMYLLLIVLFNAVRHSLVIFLCVPLSLIGVTVGLLATGSSFGFMPLLGMLSLIGMLIKNGIVLVDEIENLRRGGREALTAVLDATASRVVPVSLAAGTTILGMLPLVLDVFFKDMAIAVMFGLGFATVLTLLVVPVLYAIFFRISSKEQKESA